MNVPNPKATDHLAPEKIKYLALEGGGGKGFVFLGALQMLEKNPSPSKTNILRQIQGVAGTSAGAITALLISLGMSAKDIENEMQNPSGLKDFNDFFDPASPRLMPKPLVNSSDAYDLRPNIAPETAALPNALQRASPDSLLKLARQLQSWASQEQLSPGPPFVPDFVRGWLFNAGTVALLQWLSLASMGKEELEDRVSKLFPPLSNILTDRSYFVYLIRDMGFFCGLAARTYFDNLISNRCVKLFGGAPSDYRNLTFLRHHKLFGSNDPKRPGVGKDLLVCGANFSTGKTELFSYRDKHTPNFPVADAVRLSMSLPVVYKPYMITTNLEGWPPCGTYVDGGFWNNLPFREVDPTRQVTNTLALRLTIDEPKRVDNVFDVIGVMLSGVMGSGESQVSPEFERLTITLDTRDLSLLKFQPDDATKKKVTKRSRRIVSEYFGWLVDKADRDPDDEKKTKELLAKSACDKLGR